MLKIIISVVALTILAVFTFNHISEGVNEHLDAKFEIEVSEIITQGKQLKTAYNKKQTIPVFENNTWVIKDVNSKYAHLSSPVSQDVCDKLNNISANKLTAITGRETGKFGCNDSNTPYHSI